MPYIGNPIYQSAFVVDQFSGNGSTTAFTMSVAPAGVTNVLVAVSGVLQDPSTYGVVGNTITFSAAPPTGTGNISCRYLGVPVTGVTTTAYRTVTEFTATASQTTFTPPSYTVGFINVYLNGVLLGSADYTATNGTTVVLATGASAGNLVTVESFLVSSVLNAIPNTAGSVSSANIANDVTINFADGSASTPSITNNGDTNTGIFFPAADTIAFSEGGVESMRIDSSGNFFVNKTLYNDTSGNGFGVFPNSGIPQVSCVGAANSTQKNFTVYSSTDSAYKFYVDYAGNGYYANILFVGVTASIGGLNASGHFKNVDAGAAGIVVGNAGGTSTTNAILFTNSNGIVGGISTSGSSTSFNTASDYRLKENVLPMTNALATITALKPVTYKWKIDGSDGQGFIAHELQAVVPDAVTGKKDAVDAEGNPHYQGVDTSYIVATLTAAIQELKATVDAQAIEIAALKDK